MSRKKTQARRIPPATAPRSRNRKTLAFDGIIFDIDNVLINTHRSYHDAIRWTVEIYLTGGSVPFFQPGRKSREPEILTPQDVEQFKLLGGFNDDWDCCYGLLVYLLNLPTSAKTVEALKQAIDLKDFARKVTKRPLRVHGIVARLGRSGQVMIEKISRIFQEVYLGAELYESLTRKEPLYWNKRGLIAKEKLIFRKSTLKKLVSLGLRLGIATGRPRYEAFYGLKRFGILEYFEAITTMDEVKKAEREQRQSLRKPHPYSILETAKKLGAGKRFLYVGDLPDDILAAREAKSTLNIRSAGLPGVGRMTSEEARAEMIKAKPDFILKKPSDLGTILFQKSLPI